MKLFVLTALYLVSYSLYGQRLQSPVDQINTVDEAGDFVENNPAIAELLALGTGDDVMTEFNKKLFNKKIGEVTTDSNYTYKIMDSRTALSFRVSYIYLNSTKISMHSIDSLRRLIISKYKKGTAFQDLAKKYTMDGSPNGDLGWFVEGTMVKEFEVSVRQHKKDDIFLVDIPANSWYYVVLKTFNDTNITTLTVLKVKNGE